MSTPSLCEDTMLSYWAEQGVTARTGEQSACFIMHMLVALFSQ